MNKTVTGQTLTQTYVVDAEIVGEPMLGSLQADFPLCESDFDWLIEHRSTLREWSIGMLLLSIGYAVSVAAKYLAIQFDRGQSHVESWELWALAIGLLITFVLFVASLILPGKRERIVRRIREHFETHPRQRHIIRTGQ